MTSYRKTYNQNSIWLDYCQTHKELIKALNLPKWVFQKEGNFREFATFGKLGETETKRFSFKDLPEDLYFQLFDFIQSYFDFDAAYFNKFNERIR